ncbi:hypothetical protein [Methylobacterium radiotolerans]|uniref:hypothetical protein n=1 Tax=Methylobacterium radiotolerans TaxID=31998 RepID=UPI001F47A0B5|nr:hypothetical protein [Methylobacterium radiotolerans]UIY45825.1 hypothetical protein LZ599_32480 [Methylobacterium radiotolerans]
MTSLSLEQERADAQERFPRPVGLRDGDVGCHANVGLCLIIDRAREAVGTLAVALQTLADAIEGAASGSSAFKEISLWGRGHIEIRDLAATFRAYLPEEGDLTAAMGAGWLMELIGRIGVIQGLNQAFAPKGERHVSLEVACYANDVHSTLRRLVELVVQADGQRNAMKGLGWIFPPVQVPGL